MVENNMNKYGYAQCINPHSLRIRIADNFLSSSRWIDENNILSIGLSERKIKLQKILGKNKYKK